MRKTKIICTLGPACDDENLLKQMIQNGLDCARLNFSHGTHAEQKVRMDRVKKVREELGIPLPILLDTKGPEIRVRLFENKKVELKKGQEFTFSPDYDLIGNESIVGLTYPNLAVYVNKPGIIILADDGKVSFEVLRIEGKNVVCKVLNDATLSDRKSINIPNVIVDMPYISEADRADLVFGIQECVDYIAASFVRRKEDVLAVRELLEQYDTSGKIRIISKIENTEGIEKMDEIIEVSDGIMVARGDMGVEVPFKQLPKIQKELIQKCYNKGKIVVTATQMLDSMQSNPRPTRAEVSDVANAVLDGTDAVMLSGETTTGKFPVETVRFMADICKNTEKFYDYDYIFESKVEKDITATIAESVISCAETLDVKTIVVCTMSGYSARKISNLKPKCLILAPVPSEEVARSLALNWGVYPTVVPVYKTADQLLESAKEEAKKFSHLDTGDVIVITGGLNNKNKEKHTNFLKIEKI